jgi:hypothetical protein
MIITKGRGAAREVVFNSEKSIINVVDYINNTFFKDKIIAIHNISRVIVDIEQELTIPVRDSKFRRLLSRKLQDNFGKNSCKKVNFNYWIIRGYSNEYSRSMVKKEQSSRSSKQTEESQIKKKQTWHKNIHRQDRGYKFYIDKGLTHNEATAKLEERNNKWLKSMQNAIIKDNTINSRKGKTKDELILKHGEIKAINIITNRLCKFKGISNMQLEFIKNLVCFCNIDIDDCLFGANEWFIHKNGRIFYYDFMYDQKLIEFNGDFWHMNPKTYHADCVNRVTHTSAKDKWLEDETKSQVALDSGYNIMTVWESDYRYNRVKVLTEVLNFLK